MTEFFMLKNILLYFPKKSKDECEQLLRSAVYIVRDLTDYGHETFHARTITRGGIAQVLLQGLADLGYDARGQEVSHG